MRITSKQSALIAAGIAAVSFAGGLWWSRGNRDPQQAAAGGRRILYYHDPMHPAYKSDKPGIAPDCGMQLEPVYADDPTAGDSGRVQAPGTVKISLEKQQIMGLRTARVTRTPGAHTLRVLGKVAADETRVHRVTALADGVIRSVSAYAAGNLVKKDELLATYFVAARELYSAMQSYFIAQSALEQGVAQYGDTDAIKSLKAEVRLTQELLKTYGLTEPQMAEMARKREVTRDIEFRSPVDGLVLSRNAAVGQQVDRGVELFRIADVSRVWVLADLFENESGLVRPGSTARVDYLGRTYRGLVSEAQQFDPASRTLKVRIDLDNPGWILRPDMFVDVEFDVREPDGINVPLDAVLDSGRHKAVFVATSDGVFEPREVTVGRRYGDRVQIVKGLGEGENVVVSGLFLLDSESRLQLAAASAAKPDKPAAGGPDTDPVCGMHVDPAKAKNKSVYQGKTYFFCSPTCKSDFDKDPAKYVKQDTPAASAADTDPVCGMHVDPAKAEHKSVYQGRTYFFCSPMCKSDFDKDPAKYLKKDRQ
jgi:Cu(I)/Ag(I) efflux system membrane fusion protein